MEEDRRQGLNVFTAFRSRINTYGKSFKLITAIADYIGMWEKLASSTVLKRRAAGCLYIEQTLCMYRSIAGHVNRCGPAKGQ